MGSAINKEIGAEHGVINDAPTHDTVEDDGLEKSNSRESKSKSNRDSGSETASTCSYHEQVDDTLESPRNVVSRTVSEVRDGIESRRDLDLEEAHPTEKSSPTPDSSDPNLVTWAGPDDPENPKNWTIYKKWGAVFIVSTFTLGRYNESRPRFRHLYYLRFLR